MALTGFQQQSERTCVACMAIAEGLTTISMVHTSLLIIVAGIFFLKQLILCGYYVT
jgi:hypothetical protein